MLGRDSRLGGAQTDINTDNIALNAFRISVNGAIAIQNMIDGFSDVYTDETGIDAANSVAQVYDAANDLYSNLSTIPPTMLLHMDGANLGTTFTDSSVGAKTFTANGNAKTSTTTPKFGTASALFDGTGDWIETPNHADFAMGTCDFTIEMFVKRGATGTTQ